MATLTSTLIVRMLDQVSAPARTAAQAILGIGDAAKRAGVNASLTSRITGAIERNNAALAETRGRLVDAVGGFYLLKQTLGGAVSSAVAFESAMADVAKVSGFDDEGLKQYALELRNLAKSEIPLAVTELAALSEAAAQAGIADEDLLDFTRMTAKTAVAWGITGAAAGEALAKIKTQLGLTTEQTRLYADAINHMSDNTASSAPELINYSRRVAAQGEFFGFAANETLAFGAAMISAGAQADVASTSFRNMGRALTKGASAPKRMREAYATLGLDAEKVAKSMQENAVKTTITVIEQLQKLPEYMRASVMSDLFGDEARALAPLINNLDILKQTLGLVSDEMTYSGSVAREFARRAETTEYAWQRFKNQVNEVGLAIGNALLPAIKETLDFLGPIAGKIAALVEQYPQLTRVVVMTAAGLIGLRVALIGVRFAALMARGGLLSAILPVVKLASWAKAAAMGNVALQSSLAGMAGIKFGGLARASAAFSGIARAIPIIGGVLAGGVSAPVVVALGAIAAAGAAIYKYWDQISSFASGFASALGEQLAPAVETVKPYLEWLAPVGDAIAAGWERAKAVISAFGEWFGSFFKREALSEEQKAEWENAGADAARRMVEAIKNALNGIVEWARGLGARVGNAIAGAASSAINKLKNLIGLGGGDREGKGAEARAKGGPVRRGKTYLVGEEGPELWTAHGNGRIIPNDETMRALRDFRSFSAPGQATRSSSAASVTVHAPITVTGVSDAKEAAREVARLLVDTVGNSLRGVHADVGVS